MLTLLVLVIIWSALCVFMVYGWSWLRAGDWWAVTITVCGMICVLSLSVLLVRQPRNTAELHFRTPLVPWIPLASVLINIFLMVTLSPATWIRFAVWMTLGKGRSARVLGLRVAAVKSTWPLQVKSSRLSFKSPSKFSTLVAANFLG